VVQDIVDVLSVADVDLMRLSEEGVVPDLHERVISDTEQQMAVVLEVNRIEPVPMQCLHLHLNGHLRNVVPTNRGIFENHPQLLFVKL
jgi:hypothetical protein